MTTVNDILNKIDEIAPFSLALDFDNCGLLIGNINAQVSSCLLALDITNEVIDIAVKSNSSLIITHHPIIFNPMKSILKNDLAYKLIQNNISVISAHTNLDITTGGVNDVLCKLIGLGKITMLENSDGAVRIGEIPKSITGKALATMTKKVLNAKGVLVTNGTKLVKKIAVSSGAGGGYLQSALEAGADAFITGEVKHNQFVDAINSGITLISAGHHYTEVPIFKSLALSLEESFSEIKFDIYNIFLIEEV